MANNNFNPYEVIGGNINKESDEKAIKAAYRKAAVKYHPDRQGNKSEEEKKQAEEKFKEVQKAYEILSDPDKKQKYDLFGIIDDGSNSSSQSSGFNPFGGGGFDPFEDIRNMFGGGASRGRSQTRQAAPGEDIQMRIPLTIKDIYCGVDSKKVKFAVKTRCPNCHGSGGKTSTCPHCQGSGVITNVQRTAFGVMQQQTVCPHCQGTGKIVTEKCVSCGGSGFKTKDNIVDIKFRPGVIDGEYIQYQGQGNESKSPQGQNGSFIAIAKWNFDMLKYTVNGLDVSERVYLPYEDAIAGCKYTLILPDETKIDISIPALSQPGKRLKLRGRGIKGHDQYGRSGIGDYYIEIQYILPEALSDDEYNKLLEIKALHKMQNESSSEDENSNSNDATENA